jgi:hypothetical protein
MAATLSLAGNQAAYSSIMTFAFAARCPLSLSQAAETEMPEVRVGQKRTWCAAGTQSNPIFRQGSIRQAIDHMRNVIGTPEDADADNADIEDKECWTERNAMAMKRPLFFCPSDPWWLALTLKGE